MMGAVHLLPGTTFSNVKIRGGYNSEGRANFTLRELEKWIALEIVGKYHQRIHSSLLRPPLAVWRERQGEVDFNLPSNRMAFWTSFLPGERRRLLKDGIHLEKIRYWSDALSRDVGRGAELEIKYDPRDLSRIFVRQSDGRFIEARYRNLAFPPVSWWEWKHAKKALRDKGRYELHEDVIFGAIAQQRQIEDIAASSSAKARRSVTRRPTEPSREGHSAVQSIDLTKHNHSDDDTEYWDQ